jgi:tetratricopeptide (TPR) repeat protein
MRTIHRLPEATRRCTVILLSSALTFACVPLAEAAHDLPATSPSPFYGAFGVGQESYPSAQSVSIANAPQIGLYSVTPETLGDLMMVRQRYLAAVEAYQRAPHDTAVIWNKLGIAYQHLYALDIAKLQYEKALAMNPAYAEAMNNLGTVYYGQQNYRKAETLYQKALRIKPNTASFYSNLGTAYFADHSYKRGIQAYKKAFSIDPQVFVSDSLEHVAEMGPVEEQVALNYELAKMYAEAGMVDLAIYYLRASFIDGFNDNKKLMGDKSFDVLRKTPQFHLLMTEEHLTDPNATDQALAVHANPPNSR